VVFAPGVLFEEASHTYLFKGKTLSGVTGVIGRKLNLQFPELFVEEARLEGVHIHKAIQTWIETGSPGSAHPGVVWIMQTLPAHQSRHAEVLVSDFTQYASSVDIVGDNGDGTVDIYDMKRGAFKREYVSWQLGIYKYFIEKAGGAVRKCVCISVKDRELYPVFPKAAAEVEGLLYGA
jgi:hypothetical protein